MRRPTGTPSSHGGATAHYEALLADIYGWMVGDLATACAAGRSELETLGVGAAPPRGRVLDLGAGLGVHAVPLTEMGWEVFAVDTSEALLAQLVRREPRVHALHANLVQAAERVEGTFELIVCMGDTLTHLDSEDALDLALAGAASRLAPGGRLVLRFRDYVTRVRLGAERFLLVRADATRILTCCLDFEPQRVLVTDVVHQLEDGAWTLRASSYRKLRLAREAVVRTLEALGLEVSTPEVTSAWIDVVATRPRLVA